MGKFLKFLPSKLKKREKTISPVHSSENTDGKIKTSNKVKDVISEEELKQMFDDTAMRLKKRHSVTSDISDYSFQTVNYESRAQTNQFESLTRQQVESISSYNTDEIQLSVPTTLDNLCNDLHSILETSVLKNNKNNGKTQKVYISYVNEENKIAYESVVINIAISLRDKGIDCGLDLYENLEQAASLNTYLDNKLQQSDYVILCITPNFKKVVCSKEDLDAHSKHTLYIHNSLMSEYINSGCNNKRVIPVLCGEATEDDVPPIWQNTHVYRWPRDKESMLYKIFGMEKYQKPPIGTRAPLYVIRN